MTAVKSLAAQNKRLREQLAEAEEALLAIRSGNVDALIVSSAGGEKVFTLTGADTSYRSLIEDMSEGALVLTEEGLISYANRHFATIVKTPLEQVIGSQIQRWIAPAYQNIFRALWPFTNSSPYLHEEVSLIASDEKLVPVKFSSCVLKTNDTRLNIGLVVSDLTEQKFAAHLIAVKNAELEDQYRRVQEANRLKSEFLANMSHELRTPLNAIIGFSELMYDCKVGLVSNDHKEYLGDILTSAKHLLQLINDVLDLAKVESGKMEFYPEPVDLVKVVGEVRDVLRTLISRKRIILDVNIDPTLTGIVADSAKLKQVLYNYLSNALKFTPDGGRVTVRAASEGSGYYRIEVEDSGIGIKAEDVKRLFVEFQQLDASTAKKYQGTGLGLALTRRIVEAQSGHVGVDSALGRGSTFFALLPRVMQAGSEAKLLPEVAPGAPRVLVVQESAHDIQWLLRVLRSEGYEVQIASGGVDALAHCRARHFDAILLDILLPDMVSSDVLKCVHAKGRNQHTPVIVMSVNNEFSISQVFTLHGFMTKPVERKELLRQLKTAQVDRGHGRVLVVDDDSRVLKHMDKSLHDLGYQTLIAANGLAGLHAAERERPVVVIIDLLMPGIDAFEFLHAFRRLDRCANVPVIICSAPNLTDAERTRLYDNAKAIAVKNPEEGVESLLSELRKILVQPSPNPPAAAWRAPKLTTRARHAS